MELVPLKVDDESLDQKLQELGEGFASKISGMERAEPWAVDARVGRALTPQRVQQLASLLEKIRGTLQGYADTGAAPPGGKVIELLAHLRSGRAMALIMWCDAVWPGSSAELFNRAFGTQAVEESSFLFVDRLQHIERAMLLSRVFSPRNLRDVLEVMDAYRSDERQAA